MVKRNHHTHETSNLSFFLSFVINDVVYTLLENCYICKLKIIILQLSKVQ